MNSQTKEFSCLGFSGNWDNRCLPRSSLAKLLFYLKPILSYRLFFSSSFMSPTTHLLFLEQISSCLPCSHSFQVLFFQLSFLWPFLCRLSALLMALCGNGRAWSKDFVVTGSFPTMALLFSFNCKTAFSSDIRPCPYPEFSSVKGMFELSAWQLFRKAEGIKI